ncbi:30S ribosomal protein S4 [Rickettsiales endosymbiont of Peranema trichophorum]|uniref:30S ribosomal protein S4 n=1 Tax=Rickettsiales endosymbiont of Peranema trichophorum TaxID=2486577 RepID=UPI001022CF8A|nr:30S ribosomal protein S4 [Rickettsiales endosymbiont of Peranema trichophorum]RZI46710.1 30S ribosomal protein S4 [Rickettsiales endosymbiont of Peranema trichophorum]
MSKRSNRKFGSSRRLGVNLWGMAKDPFVKRNFPPGAHGTAGYKKLTDYGIQLQAKQKLKKYYGNIVEVQFRNIYREAARRKGDTGENLIALLESRLDAFIYRAKIAPTVFSARQLVNHKHILVNGKIINIPSYRLKPGDVVEVTEKARQMDLIKGSILSNERSVPEYIAVDQDGFQATYVQMPEFKQVPYPILMNPYLVVGFYSRQ